MTLALIEDLLAIFEVGLVACRTQRRRRRSGHHFDVVAGFLGQVKEFFVDDAGYTFWIIFSRRIGHDLDLV